MHWQLPVPARLNCLAGPLHTEQRKKKNKFVIPSGLPALLSLSVGIETGLPMCTPTKWKEVEYVYTREEHQDFYW